MDTETHVPLVSPHLIATIPRPLRLLKRLSRSACYHIHTAALFTAADIKTVFFPVSVFAGATAPACSVQRLLNACAWLWLHQFMLNVSNQSKARAEDALNKPWRPLPSGRITEPNAARLRLLAAAACILASALCGWEMLLVTLGLVAASGSHEELGLASHHLGKNVCNGVGYILLEVGTTKLASVHPRLDWISLAAVGMSGAMVFTTVQAQDFADVDGDRQRGRVTLPICAPRIARGLTLCALVSWSLFLGWFWDIGAASHAAFALLGISAGVRYYVWRDVASDRRSYVLYNVWVTAAHLLPLHSRVGLLSL